MDARQTAHGQRYGRVDLLCIDELGYMQLDRRGAEMLFQVLTDEPDTDTQFNVPPEQLTTELLELCEEFLRQASPIVHTELRQFLTNTVTTAVSLVPRRPRLHLPHTHRPGQCG